MDSKEFLHCRKSLGKTQKQLAGLLGTSLKAVHSYEQGWRNIPTHVERQLLFLISRKMDMRRQKFCWRVKKCPPERSEQCPAREFKSGRLCWFINGTSCDGVTHKNWKDKMKICRSCEVFTALFENVISPSE